MPRRVCTRWRGVGFNLGLRDTWPALAELIAENAPAPDPGGAALLRDWIGGRRADRRGVIAFTDGLVRLFLNPLSSVRRLRNLGLLASICCLRKIRAVAPQHRRRRPCSKLARGVALT